MYLGLDLGTSSLKALLVDAEGRVVAEATAPLTVERPHSGWSEQDPASWTEACAAAVGALGADLSSLRAIGLAGHMHGATLVGADDAALRPCLLWNDTRAGTEAAELDDAEARRITGNIVFPGFTAPKAEWVRRHEPETWARMTRILLPKDYLRLWLTGEAVSEMSDAAGTAWLDVGARDWSDSLLARQGLGREHMPRLVEGSEVSGRLRDAVADRLGLPRGVAVAGGAGDNAAAAIGTGAVAPGQGFVSLGTSGVLFVSADSFRPDAESAVHTFCHAVPDTWHQMGVILSATDSLEWAARLTGRDAAALTGGDLQAPGQTLFLPYLGGERTPHNDAEVRGTLLGIEHATDAAALGRAVMAGVAYALADCRDALAATGTRVERLLAVGGGARSDHWLKMIATVLDHPLEVPAGGAFGAALGACRLAMMADGAGPEVAAAPEIARVVEPEADLVAPYAEGHARFRAAYAPVRGL
ncbi:xylulokinase [Jannaschia ovalis]|uniref:Xylulose kinase n=1 Tax=Jannaschia ovalis TaxID=3038773 RepID=A0ABY8LIB3_9RHOB|nr:xylulokinase [Jannaschia sp. GRR-S6-38]WGH80130.1 xylulokinase [Jannaschia sp. GRR-S6-38]